MPQLAFIGNPVAGNGKALKLWPKIENALKRKGWEYSINWSKNKEHAEELSKIKLSEAPGIIVALGGDGTINSVIQGFYKNNFLGNNTLFTAFPCGTGNDWCRYWKISDDIDIWVKMIAAGKSFDHDLGLIEYTTNEKKKESAVFNNVAGIAYDAYVVDYIESKKKKMKVGGLQYLYFIFRCLFGYKLQESRIRWEGKEMADKFYTINIGICPYSGGGLRLVPHAVPDDGLLAITAIRPLNKLQVLLLSRHFYSGKIHLHNKAISFNTESLEVLPVNENEIIRLESEGELIGNLPVKISVIKKAVKICAP